MVSSWEALPSALGMSRRAKLVTWGSRYRQIQVKPGVRLMVMMPFAGMLLALVLEPHKRLYHNLKEPQAEGPPVVQPQCLTAVVRSRKWFD